MRAIRGVVVLAVLGAIVPACAKQTVADRPEARGPTRCSPPIEAPAGFELVESLEDPYSDHVGVRVSLRDADGDELHLFSGIPGEFGEGLPLDSNVTVGGVQGRLLGQDGVWVIAWTGDGPCGVKAILSNGLSRKDFLDVVEPGSIEPA